VAESTPLSDEQRKAITNERILCIGPIAKQLTEERTSLESRIIPVSAYVVTSCVEAFLRYPDLLRAIDAAMPAEEIGRRARRPGCPVNAVRIWTIPNLWLIGRRVWSALDPAKAHDLDAAYGVMEFWERLARAYFGDDHRHAADTGHVAPYDRSTVDALMAGVVPVDDELRRRIRTFNATLVAYLFLLHFDTRVGHGDTGPNHLPNGDVLLVRDFYEIGQSDFWWSDVAAGMPYRSLTAAMVLRGVTIDRITDFGTSYTTPEDFLENLVGFALYTTDGMPAGEVRQVPLDEMEPIVAEARKAQRAHYRNITAMTRDEKIRCGAYVYFAFLRALAVEAGVEDQLDWTTPRDIPEPVYQLVSAITGEEPPAEPTEYYYDPLP